MATVALAGDTMLGRGVAERLATDPPAGLVSEEIAALTGDADLFVLNLECCISERGSPWPAPGKPFFFRAPPAAVEALVSLGVDCVTLANNHALDYGEEALLDTIGFLEGAGIAVVGAGPDVRAARAPVVLEARDLRLAVIGVADHPEDFAAGPDGPGIAHAELSREVPGWLLDAVADPPPSDATMVTPHWGPNMVPDPVPHVREAARALTDAGATLIAGHSAHVFHGVRGRVLFDLGDLVDDYAVDPVLRNDLGLLSLVTFDGGTPVRLEAVPLKLEYCRTEPARGEDLEWIRRRFRAACAAMGTEVGEEGDRLVVSWR